MKIKQSIFDIILGACIPILIAVKLLSPILFTPGIPFYGDEVYFTKWYLPDFFSSQLDALYAWIQGSGPNSILTLPQYTLPLTFFELLFGHPTAVKLLLILMASLPAMSTYVAIRILISLWFNRTALNGSMSVKQMAAFTGGLATMLSFTNSGLTQWGASMLWPYAMLPLFFAFFARFLKRGKWYDVLIASFATILASVQPIWIHVFFIMAALYFFMIFFNKTKISLIKNVALTLGSILLFNAFWFVPILFSYILGAGGTFETYVTEKLITLGSLRFLGHWNLLDVIMVGEHQYYFFWLHPQNYGPLNAIIPILASASVLIFRRNKYVLFMALALVVGIFFTKGVWEPGGYLYYLIASSLPYGAGAILRNPTKFVPLVTFPYAFLVGLFMAKVYEKLSSLRFKRVGALYSSLRLVLLAGLILLVLSPVTYGTLLYLQGYTWPRYNPTYVPQVYGDINSWLSKQEGNFKVMWIPSGGAYVWKPYIITAFPDLYSSRPTVSFSKIYPEPLKSVSNIGELLKALGVKYVIYHGDSLEYRNEDMLSQLTKQNDLKQVLYLNYTYNATDNSKASLPVGENIMGVPLEFNNIPFRITGGDSVLPRGRATNITLYYSLPSFIVEQGFIGKFWDGFSIRLEVLPAGSADINQRVYESFVLKQTMINETSGYVLFRINIPQNYNGTAVDVYANIYDGGFKPLSPLYYIGRFMVKPSYLTIPFIVFENEDYVGQTYIASGNATILSSKHINPVEANVVVNASTPFTLIFTEPFDRLWRAYVNGKEVSPEPMYGAVNGFEINETGTVNITLYYTLQNFYYLGWFVSGAGFIVFAVMFVREAISKRISERRQIFTSHNSIHQLYHLVRFENFRA